MLTFVCGVLIAVSIGATADDEIPLEAPKKSPTLVAPASAPTEVELAAPPSRAVKPLGLVIGAKIGAAFAATGGLATAVLAAVELGYRFPVWERRIGVSIEPAFSNPSAVRSTELGTVRGTTFALSVPLLASVNVELGPGLIRALAGPSLEWVASQAALRQFTFNERVTGVGAAITAGYVFHLGPGALGLELRYRVSPTRVAAQAILSHTIGVTAAYVFLL
ncbi:MAG: hypothetical protein IT381_15655 [Deltaproteobacteria bacterium]|nr:hypothetical protein [Deltaproteobacteria bacterium]